LVVSPLGPITAKRGDTLLKCRTDGISLCGFQGHHQLCGRFFALAADATAIRRASIVRLVEDQDTICTARLAKGRAKYRAQIALARV
jgi:hypothetical protein